MDCGKQGGGDLKHDRLMKGRQVCADHNHHMHHITVAVGTQIAIGAVGVNSIRRCVFIAGVLIPEACIIAVCICIPANVIAPVMGRFNSFRIAKTHEALPQFMMHSINSF